MYSTSFHRQNFPIWTVCKYDELIKYKEYKINIKILNLKKCFDIYYMHKKPDFAGTTTNGIFSIMIIVEKWACKNKPSDITQKNTS